MYKVVINLGNFGGVNSKISLNGSENLHILIFKASACLRLAWFSSRLCSCGGLPAELMGLKLLVGLGLVIFYLCHPP